MTTRRIDLRTFVTFTAALLVAACDDPSPDSAGATADTTSTGEVEDTSTTGDPTTGGEVPTTGTLTIDPSEPPEPPELVCTHIDESPQLVATIPQAYASLAFLDDLMIGINHARTDVIDIADPTDPILVEGDSQTTPDGQFVTVADGRVLVYDGEAIAEVEIVQSHAHFLGRAIITLAPQRFVVDSGVAYASDGIDDVIFAIDIADLHGFADFAHVHAEIPGPADGLLVADGHLFAAGDALRVFSLADPKAPALVAEHPLTDYAINVARHDDYLYVATRTPADLHIFDVSDPGAPVDAGTFELVGHTPELLTIAGGFAFVGDHSHIHVFDLAVPTSPVPVAMLTFPDRAYEFAVRGEFLYVPSFSDVAERTEVFRLCTSR